MQKHCQATKGQGLNISMKYPTISNAFTACLNHTQWLHLQASHPEYYSITSRVFWSPYLLNASVSLFIRVFSDIGAQNLEQLGKTVLAAFAALLSHATPSGKATWEAVKDVGEVCRCFCSRLLFTLTCTHLHTFILPTKTASMSQRKPEPDPLKQKLYLYPR